MSTNNILRKFYEAVENAKADDEEKLDIEQLLTTRQLKIFTLHEEIVIAWQYRQDALHTRLLNLLCTLDPDNTERLRLGFPDHVRALERYGHEPGWWNVVQSRRNLNP